MVDREACCYTPLVLPPRSMHRIPSRPGASKALWVLVGVVVLVLLWIFSGYNRLVTQRENVTTAWSHVEAQYQRRFDLVPNLVNTVKGAANFEQSTLQGVTEARTKWLGSGGDRPKQIAAAEQFDSALSRLLVTVESYPQLKATQAFSDLMTQLEGTENRITVARNDYNDAVRSYNLTVKTFPGNILASSFGYAPEQFFESTEGADKAPAVTFGQ